MSDDEEEVGSLPLLSTCIHEEKKLKISSKPDESAAVLSQIVYSRGPAQLETSQDAKEEEWIKQGYVSKFDWAVENKKIQIDELDPDQETIDPHNTQITVNRHLARTDDKAILLGCAGSSPVTSDSDESTHNTGNDQTVLGRRNTTTVHPFDRIAYINQMNQTVQDPTNWAFIPLYAHYDQLGESIDLEAVMKMASAQEREEEENVRQKEVLALGKRMYRYKLATLALIKRHTPSNQKNLYIKQELFAEKVSNLAIDIVQSKMPVHIMSANAIQKSFKIDAQNIAQFIERMGFYDKSEVTFDYAERNHDAKSIMVVHRSSVTTKTLTVCYRWSRHPIRVM